MLEIVKMENFQCAMLLAAIFSKIHLTLEINSVFTDGAHFTPDLEVSIFTGKVDPNQTTLENSLGVPRDSLTISISFGGIDENILNYINSNNCAILLSLEKSSELLATLNRVSVHLAHQSLFILMPIEYEKDLSSSELKEILEYGVSKETNLSKIFDLASTTYLIFYSTNATAGFFAEVWEMYFIKERPFVNLIVERERYKSLINLLDAITLKSLPIVIRRQNWENVNFTSALFLADIADQNAEFLEASEASSFEINVKRLQNGGFELVPSLSAKLLWDFKTMLNFTSTTIPPFTYEQSFSDVFEIHNDSFDIILSHFGIVPEKLHYSRNLLPTYYNSITAFFVQPPIHTFRNIFARPLTLEMWAMVFSSWTLIIISFKIIHWIRVIYQVGTCPGDTKIDEKVEHEICWWAVGAACQQGWYVTPNSFATRVVFITGVFFSFLCYSSYTATIVSQLSKTSVPIKDIDMLLNHAEEILFGGNSDVADMIIKGMIGKPIFSKIRRVSTQSSVEKILHKNRGYSCHLGWPEYYTERLKKLLNTSSRNTNLDQLFCQEISTYKYTPLPVKAAMFVPKGSPFVEILNYRIMIGWERGYINRYWKEFDHNTKVTCVKDPNTSYALGLPDTWMAFALLLVGYSLSISILLIELFVEMKSENKIEFQF